MDFDVLIEQDEDGIYVARTFSLINFMEVKMEIQIQKRTRSNCKWFLIA